MVVLKSEDHNQVAKMKMMILAWFCCFNMVKVSLALKGVMLQPMLNVDTVMMI